MSEVKVNIRDNGPLLVEGPFKLVDGDGNEYQLPADKPAFALCRCGASSNRPFCDGAHKTAGFNCSARAPSDS
ncbi:MAG: CDGSH iron-sulfur domain-containing protein [Planctomycetes bacterium]|nr:CDGSH iron-sulfur domain-containing protein [Planctomycetota bacterium]